MTQEPIQDDTSPPTLTREEVLDLIKASQPPAPIDPKDLTNLSELKLDQLNGFLNLIKDWRGWLLAAPAMYLGAEYVPDTIGIVKALIVALVCLSFAHIARKVLIPSIDNQALVTLMGNSPVALAIVYFSNTLIYVVAAISFVWALQLV